jgi:hypothetical protein
MTPRQETAGLRNVDPAYVPKTNAYRPLVDPRDWTCGFISRADVADFLVKQIDDDTFLHKTPVLTTSESVNVAVFVLVSRPLTSQYRRPSGARTTRPQFELVIRG